MENWERRGEELLEFIDKSPSAFHAAANLAEMLEKREYRRLREEEDWEICPGGRYYVTRNDSSIIAFALPELENALIRGFHIAAAHSDSPSFKIKEKPEVVSEKYVRLNVEKYGGPLVQTWLDRALSAAGRAAFLWEGNVMTKLVNIDRDLLVIPNLAIHMAGKEQEYNIQTDLLPLYGEEGGKNAFQDCVAEAAGIEKEALLAWDLFLYVREKGKRIGGNGEYILSPRLDDLQCAFAAMTAMAESDPASYINLCAVFDNEEVGSGTRQGADSTFLEDVLVRIREGLGQTDAWLRQRIAGSLLISADNAHGVHPAHPEKSDPANRPCLNGGIVLKYHGGQKYTTDAVTAAQLKLLCGRAQVPLQTYTNRSDMAGGSTLGNISVRHVSVPSVDIGLPQLAMHSAVETAGAKDTDYAVRLFRVFYEG